MMEPKFGRPRLWRLVAVLSAALAGAPATARWESTNWNMTPEQVAEAMAGQAPLSRGSYGDRLGGKRIGNVGRHRIGEATFRAVYHYDTEGLALVALHGTAGSCRDIIEGLLREHGRPVKVSDQIILRLIIWHDQDAGNRIRLLRSEGICNLNYERLSDYEAIDRPAVPPQ